MFDRIINLNKNLEESIFLFGARQTGKSTMLRQLFKGCTYIDLLDTDLKKRFARRPALLYDMLHIKKPGTIVVIDEIPEVPELLNEIHRLMSEFQIIFILCGSSARKLKRRGHNTLGGRALPVYMFPLVSAEIPDMDIDKAVNFGMIPSHYTSKRPLKKLKAYVDVYIKEEIVEEALVRDLNSFNRFMEIAALTDGEIINNQNIAQECGVSATTVNAYFDILVDTLIGYRIEAYKKVKKRRLVQAPRFYFFDVGLANYLLGRHELVRGTPEYGHAFEHLVIQELLAYLSYTESEERLSYWRTYTGMEVDAVIGDARVAVEIKSTEEIMPKHLKGLKAFGEEHPQARKIIVSLDRINRNIGDVECLYIKDFFNILWANSL